MRMAAAAGRPPRAVQGRGSEGAPRRGRGERGETMILTLKDSSILDEKRGALRGRGRARERPRRREQAARRERRASKTRSNRSADDEAGENAATV